MIVNRQFGLQGLISFTFRCLSGNWFLMHFLMGWPKIRQILQIVGNNFLWILPSLREKGSQIIIWFSSQKLFQGWGTLIWDGNFFQKKLFKIVLLAPHMFYGNNSSWWWIFTRILFGIRIKQFVWSQKFPLNILIKMLLLKTCCVSCRW